MTSHPKRLPPLALYVHMPWCVQKCPYCDFNSHRAENVDETGYIEVLLEDLENELHDCEQRTIETVFIGGGTPSLFSGGAITRLLEGIDRRSALPANVEITLEANPGSADASHFSDYRKAGVNRLSIGVQSLDNHQLARLGRVHDRDQALQAYDAARSAGFDNINLDLMFGLPGQTGEQMIADLETAARLEPEHLSWYQLTLEPNTPFYRQPPAGLPDDDQLAAMATDGIARLSQYGYRQYEVSAYARDGQQCRHNLNYWQFGDYLGIGAGAHGKLTLPGGEIYRRSKQRHPRHYMEKMKSEKGRSTQTRLSREDVLLEFMLNALRLNDGFSRKLFEQRTGLPYSLAEPQVSDLLEQELLSEEHEIIRPTALGRAHLNALLLQFT